MRPRVPHHIRHGCLLPPDVNLRVTFLAGLGAHVMCRARGARLSHLILPAEGTKAANEENELPTIPRGFLVRTAPGRHSGDSAISKSTLASRFSLELKS